MIGNDGRDDFNKPIDDFNKPIDDFNKPTRQVQEPTQTVQDDFQPIRSFDDFFERYMEQNFPDADPEQERRMRRSLLLILGTLFCGTLYFSLYLAFGTV
jgi:hypothetical protein